MGDNERDESLSEEERKKHPGIRNLENPDIQQGILKKPGHRAKEQEAASKERQRHGAGYQDANYVYASEEDKSHRIKPDSEIKEGDAIQVDIVRIKKGQKNKDYEYTPGDMLKQKGQDNESLIKSIQESQTKKQLLNEKRLEYIEKLSDEINKKLAEHLNNNNWEFFGRKVPVVESETIKNFILKQFANDINKIKTIENLEEYTNNSSNTPDKIVNKKFEMHFDTYFERVKSSKHLIQHEEEIRVQLITLRESTDLYKTRLESQILQMLDKHKLSNEYVFIENFKETTRDENGNVTNIGPEEFTKTINFYRLHENIDNLPKELVAALKKYELATEIGNTLGNAGADIYEKKEIPSMIWTEIKEIYDDPANKQILNNKPSMLDTIYMKAVGHAYKAIGSLFSEKLENKGHSMLATAAVADAQSKLAENLAISNENISTNRLSR